MVVMRSNYRGIIPLIDLASKLGVSRINYKMLIRASDESWALSRELKPEDPLIDKELCREILKVMDRAFVHAREKGVFLTNEAVRPAIYNRFPDLVEEPLDDTAWVADAETEARVERAIELVDLPIDELIRLNTAGSIRSGSAAPRLRCWKLRGTRRRRRPQRPRKSSMKTRPRWHRKNHERPVT